MGVGGFFLYEPSNPETELRAAWVGITWAKQELYAERILIEGISPLSLDGFRIGPSNIMSTLSFAIFGDLLGHR